MDNKITFGDFLDQHPEVEHAILQHGTNSQPTIRYFDFMGSENLIGFVADNEPVVEGVLEHKFQIVPREEADWCMCKVDGYEGKAILDETAVWCTW